MYKENNEQVPVDTTITMEDGIFYFTPIQPGQYVLIASHTMWVYYICLLFCLLKNTLYYVMSLSQMDVQNKYS